MSGLALIPSAKKYADALARAEAADEAAFAAIARAGVATASAEAAEKEVGLLRINSRREVAWLEARIRDLEADLDVVEKRWIKQLIETTEERDIARVRAEAAEKEAAMQHALTKKAKRTEALLDRTLRVAMQDQARVRELEAALRDLLSYAQQLEAMVYIPEDDGQHLAIARACTLLAQEVNKTMMAPFDD